MTPKPTKYIQVKVQSVNTCLIESTDVFEFPEEDWGLIIEMMQYLKKEKGG